MANIASAKTRASRKKRTLRNSRIKSQIRFSTKKFLEAIDSADSDKIEASLKETVRVIDKAASKGVMHKNTAARKKSKLYKKLSELNNEI